MRRWILITLALLVALVAFTAIRGNRHTPGAAAVAGPEARLAAGIQRLDLRFPGREPVRRSEA